MIESDDFLIEVNRSQHPLVVGCIWIFYALLHRPHFEPYLLRPCLYPVFVQKSVKLTGKAHKKYNMDVKAV